MSTKRLSKAKKKDKKVPKPKKVKAKVLKPKKAKAIAGFVEPDEKELVDLGSGKDDELDSGDTAFAYIWEEYCPICECTSSDKHRHCVLCDERLTEEHHKCPNCIVPIPQFSDQLMMGYQILETNRQKQRKMFAQTKQKHQVLQQELEVLSKEKSELQKYEYARTGNWYRLIDGYYMTIETDDCFAKPDEYTKGIQHEIRWIAWRICQIQVEQIEMREQLRFTICNHDFMQIPNKPEWECKICERHVFGFELKKTLDEATY